MNLAAKPEHPRAGEGISLEMEVPRVDPVGLTEIPEGFVRRPRRYAPGMRGLALLMLGIFGASVVGTTVYSLASWCLTTIASPLPFVSTG